MSGRHLVVICTTIGGYPTTGGHSGGPCVNQRWEVIGMLSRSDPADSQRCYISPTSEWEFLLKIAKSKRFQYQIASRADPAGLAPSSSCGRAGASRSAFNITAL
jgi:hypothetical protein